MGYEWFIGLRYMKAKRSTSFISVITFISVAGITVGVTALIIVLSVMTGFEEDLRSKILGINAHVTVMEFGGAMKDYDGVMKKAAKIEGVEGVTPFIYAQALLSSKGGVTGAVVRGIDLETFSSVMVLKEKIKEGSADGLKKTFREASKAGTLPGVVLGRELARSLGVWLGDEVKVVAPSFSGSGLPRTASFKVAGVFELGMFEYDSSMAFVSLQNAQTFFKLEGQATGVEIKLKDLDKAEEARKEIDASLQGPYWSRTWMDMNKSLFSAIKLEKAAMFIILTLIIMVAALNIISSLIMVVMEKGREIAVLKSLGATSGGIMRIFMIEGAVIGISGTFLGAVIGVLVALNLETVVGFIEKIFHFKVLPPSVYYIDKLPSKVDPTVVLVIVGVSVAVSLLATVYPSWKASRLDPVEGLRYE